MNRLGYPRYGAQGGDWGARVTIELARRHPASLAGIHLNMVPTIPSPAPRMTTSPSRNEMPSKPSPATARKARATSRSSRPARSPSATA